MKRFWRTSAWCAAAAVLLVTGLLAYATARGRLMWFRSLQDVVITEDGKAVAGSLHHSEAGQAFILTRILPQRAESYWIVLPGERPGHVSSCGDWSAPGLPLFFISSLTPPCFIPVKEGPGLKPPSGPSDRQLVVTRSTLAFLADDGEQIQTSWK
jgi:hypothetical protein